MFFISDRCTETMHRLVVGFTGQAKGYDHLGAETSQNSTRQPATLALVLQEKRMRFPPLCSPGNLDSVSLEYFPGSMGARDVEFSVN